MYFYLLLIRLPRRNELKGVMKYVGKRPLTLALLAIPLVAWLTDAVIGLGCVLAEGINVAVIRTLRTLVCICTSTSHKNAPLDLRASGLSRPWCWVR